VLDETPYPSPGSEPDDPAPPRDCATGGDSPSA
jgi:hypothetical protein